jgi:hypothetical protein
MAIRWTTRRWPWRLIRAPLPWPAPTAGSTDAALYHAMGHAHAIVLDRTESRPGAVAAYAGSVEYAP